MKFNKKNVIQSIRTMRYVCIQCEECEYKDKDKCEENICEIKDEIIGEIDRMTDKLNK